MAQLTDYLPMVNDGKKIVQPYDKGPSIFEGLAKGAGQAMDALEGAKQTRDRQAAAARQAQKDALEASDRGAGNLVAEQLLTIGTLGRPDSALNTQFGGGTSVVDPSAAT